MYMAVVKKYKKNKNKIKLERAKNKIILYRKTKQNIREEKRDGR
jgi:hypothetical protein